MSFSAAEDGIRSYGPGKFYTVLDSYAYEVSGDGGADEEASYGEGNGWYGLLWVDKNLSESIREIAKENDDELTEEEEDLLKSSKAVIFFERSDGIVEADWFDTKDEAEKAWANVLVDTEEGEEEEDDEEEEEEESE
jgi:CO dehydrogenase/acetyl-CoA synthase beta subunit